MSRLLFALCSVAVCYTPAGAHTPADADSPGGVSWEQVEAALAARAAGERLHHYRFVEFPRQVRELDDAIRLAEAKVSVLAARSESYRPFRSFNQYSVAYTADQNVRLHLLHAQQRLRNLQNERTNLNLRRRATIRFLQRERLAALHELASAATPIQE